MNHWLHVVNTMVVYLVMAMIEVMVLCILVIMILVDAISNLSIFVRNTFMLETFLQTMMIHSCNVVTEIFK